MPLPSTSGGAWLRVGGRNKSTDVQSNPKVEFAARNVIHHQDTKNTKRAEYWPRFELIISILRALVLDGEGFDAKARRAP